MNLLRRINKIRDWDKFTLKRYGDFLDRISKYNVVTCDMFRWVEDEVVITIRHDIDRDLHRAIAMKELELSKGIHSSWFVLHSASYYQMTPARIYLYLQVGGEVGFHNDLQRVKNPESFLISELYRLRSTGLEIIGTSAHGPGHNRDFWKTHDLEGFGLEYEIDTLEFNKYYADHHFIDNHRWHPDMMPKPQPGDRIQILIHPQWWHD